MKLVEVAQPTPDIIRLFLEPRLQAGNFIHSLLNSLGQEKANNFHNVNQYLESSLGDANGILEDLGDFQLFLEQGKGADRLIELDYEDLKESVQACLVDLHRSKIRLNDLKVSLCRFIVAYESPSRTAPRHYNSVEEWMDAATLAEMRLVRSLQPNGDRNLQRLLALFMTFRSIVCSYDGPAMFIRQLENSLASLDAIYEKVRLEMEVQNATRKLVETRKELSTVKINLSTLEHQLLEKKYQTEQLSKLMSLQEKPAFPRIALTGLFLAALAVAAGYFLLEGNRPERRRAAGEVISQQACREIHNQLEKSPRYKSQVLIFRKFGRDVYFKANAMTCEKLHRLDSTQLISLSELLKADFEAGNQSTASFGINRVLQVKDIGINKLVVKLSNRTEQDLHYKLKVLERATTLRAILQPDLDGMTDDLLIVDLGQYASRPEP
jgi:hypothetical protein